MYLYCRTNVQGYFSYQFAPYDSVTRAQFVKVAVLSFGWPLNLTGGPHFTDVPTNYYAYYYIETAYNKGIINGYDPNTCASVSVQYPCFLPETYISRGQMAKLVSQSNSYADTDVSTLNDFSDVPIGSTFHDYIERLYVHHVTTGANCTPRCYQPSLSTSRADMTVFIYNAFNQPADGRFARFRRTDAVKYADYWTSNVYNGTCNQQYHCYLNDCTNYASQILAAGHFGQVNEGAHSPYSWYWNSDDDHSDSWPLANELEHHFQAYPPPNHMRAQVISNYLDLKNGDIILFFDPNAHSYDHTREAVGFGMSKVRVNNCCVQIRDLLADQHSTNRYLVPWSDGYDLSVTPVELWHITY